MAFRRLAPDLDYIDAIVRYRALGWPAGRIVALLGISPRTYARLIRRIREADEMARESLRLCGIS